MTAQEKARRERIDNEHKRIERVIALWKRGMLTHDEMILDIVETIHKERSTEGKRELSRHLEYATSV